MKPYFSIIIPAHNEEKYIRPTLHSIKNQSLQDFETIVVANGCTDKTEEIVKKRVNEKLRFLSLPNANVSVARNAGALNAQGEVLLFLDADTQLEADGLKKIKNHFTNNYAVATTKIKPEPPHLKFKVLMGIKTLYNQTKIFKGFSGALICRKKDFHQVGGYNPYIIIKEQHDLRTKLEKIGTYKCINTYTTTSMRRFNKWSLPKAALFWLKAWGKHYFGGDLSKSDYEKVR